MTDVAARLSTAALSAEEIADGLWLASRMTSAVPSRPEPEPAQEPSVPPKPSPVASSPPEPQSSETLVVVEETGEEPARRTEPPAPRVLVAPLRPESMPAPEPLPHPGGHDLPPGLDKALRPLNRRVASLRERELAEEETAVAAAESGVWLPVHRASTEHPYEVVLVVDNGSSMRIWQRTAEAFLLMLTRQGAFSDVKCVSIDTDAEKDLLIDTAHGTQCHPAQLADPTGHRIILTLTDGVGRAWRNGAMFRVITSWSRVNPVSVIHVGPPERWAWTGFRVEPRTVHHLRPGSANSIPVLALERRYLRRWAELLAGRRDVRLPVLLPPEEAGEEVDGGDVLSAEERFQQFRATALPQTVRLAGLLAAAPLTLRVMQAVQGVCLPDSRTWHLAEVLLSRLVHLVPGSERAPEPEPRYRFAPGIRPQLLATASRNDTARVLRVVGDVLGGQVPAFANLRRVLRSPEQGQHPTGGNTGQRVVLS